MTDPKLAEMGEGGSSNNSSTMQTKLLDACSVSSLYQIDIKEWNTNRVQLSRQNKPGEV